MNSGSIKLNATETSGKDALHEFKIFMRASKGLISIETFLDKENFRIWASIYKRTSKSISKKKKCENLLKFPAKNGEISIKLTAITEYLYLHFFQMRRK